MNTQGQFDDDTTTLILVGLLAGPAVLATAVGIAASRTPAAATTCWHQPQPPRSWRFLGLGEPASTGRGSSLWCRC